MVRASGKKGGSILPRASASHVVPIVEFDPSSRIARDLCDHRVSRRLGPAGDSEEDQPKLRVLARNCHGTAPGTRAVTPASPFASSMKGLSKRFPSNPLARCSRRASELPGGPEKWRIQHLQIGARNAPSARRCGLSSGQEVMPRVHQALTGLGGIRQYTLRETRQTSSGAGFA